MLRRGPGEVGRRRRDLGTSGSGACLAAGVESDLGLVLGSIDTNAVARIVAGWIEGKTVSEIAPEFSGEEADRVRKAGAYVFSTVSQTIAWGAHAYIRGWSLHNAIVRRYCWVAQLRVARGTGGRRDALVLRLRAARRQ